MLRSKVLGRKIHVNTIEYDMKPYKYNMNIVTSKNTFKIAHKDICTICGVRDWGLEFFSVMCSIQNYE